MGQETGISWCDITLNPWIGCTKVSPACIAFHHKQNGGLRGKDSGCLLDGIEHKAFPLALAA